LVTVLAIRYRRERSADMTGLAGLRDVSDSAQLHNADRFAILPALPGLSADAVRRVVREVG